MGLSRCWQHVPRGGPRQPEAPLLRSPNTSTTAYARSKPAAAEVGVGAVPKCHEAAPLPPPSSTKSLLCPQPSGGRSVLPPGQPQQPEPVPWWGPPIPGFLEGAQPPHLSHKHLHQHSGRSSAKARRSRAPSGSQPLRRDSLGKAGGGPANPIPSPLRVISSSPLLSTNMIWPKAAQVTLKQDRQAPRTCCLLCQHSSSPSTEIRQ